MDTAALILAGGRSSRFGRDKGLLELNGERVIHRLAGLCRDICGETLILCGQRERFHVDGVGEVADLLPDRGPLGGLYTGMCASGAAVFLLLACDMPLFDPALARDMLGRCTQEYDACVPRDGDRLEPLCAVYRRTALPAIAGMLAAGEYRMRALYPQIRVRWLDRAEWPRSSGGRGGFDAFYNINFPADYARLL